MITTMLASPSQKFTSKERDAETGLDFFLARYYSGAQGRFTSPDKPFVDQHSKNPQSWNIYAYALNNPLRFVDLDGFEVIETKEVKPYPVTGRNADEAVRNANKHFGNDMGGLTTFTIQVVNEQPSEPSIASKDATYTASVTLVNADVKLDQVIEIPKWSSTDPVEQAKFDAAVNNTKDHEEEHAKINRSEAEALDRSLPGTSGKGRGETPGAAVQNAADKMQENLQKKQHHSRNAAQARGDQLDIDTNHGKNP